MSGNVNLTPRKKPRQARSQATVDAIFEATIQVLLTEGPQRLTTIRVAERAGTSVGTLYQYYPNKQALLFAVVERHVQEVAIQVSRAAESVHGRPLADIVSTVVGAFVQAKIERIDESRALYLVSRQLDAHELSVKSEERGLSILTTALKTASDVHFEDLPSVAYLLMAVMVGPTTFMIEGGATPTMLRTWSSQLEVLCFSYLERAAHRLR
ncbi:TetR/AcrR family transcriptional regulator [Pantoea cypripedii]|uniref:TetR/AcrR family transcriptional regulator n=1 Tax=Pantoea cypripedii TaxID=55209 RepID=A0A6B9GBD7_PANCY|nr:TetR/AcrR family transcriptional regulator [Pantoea cypripedii]QGY33203.1 TetR/AcrR family transcriptional regulator [Pantoea cypripedii]